MNKIHIIPIIILLSCAATFAQQHPAVKKHTIENNAKNRLELLKEKYGEHLRVFQETGEWNKKKCGGNGDYVIKEELAQRWSSNNWENDYRTNYSYDSKWNLVESTWSAWESGWVNSSKNDYTYNMQNKLIEHISYEWNTQNILWKPYSKHIFTYNTQGKLFEKISYDWALVGSAWNFSEKYCYNYDTNELMKEEINYMYLGSGVWRIHHKNIFSYTSDKINDILYMSCEYDSIWTNSYKTIYSYDSNNLQIEIIGQEWAQNTWNNSGKYTYAYDSTNKLIEEQRFHWNTNNSDWYNWLKFIYKYDSNNNKIETLMQEWDWINNSQWNNYGIIFHTYDKITSIQTHTVINKSLTTFKMLKNGIYFNSPKINNQNLLMNIYNLKGSKIGFSKSVRFKDGFLFNMNNNKESSNMILIAIFDEKMKLIAQNKTIIVK